MANQTAVLKLPNGDRIIYKDGQWITKDQDLQNEIREYFELHPPGYMGYTPDPLGDMADKLSLLYAAEIEHVTRYDPSTYEEGGGLLMLKNESELIEIIRSVYLLMKALPAYTGLERVHLSPEVSKLMETVPDDDPHLMVDGVRVPVVIDDRIKEDKNGEQAVYIFAEMDGELY